MNISRRGFLSGAAAFGSLFGGRLFAAPLGWKHGGKPNLVFGVVSDTHLRTAWNGRSVDRAHRYLKDFQRAFVSRSGFHLNGDQLKCGLSR